MSAWRWWQSVPVHVESTLTSEQALARMRAQLASSGGHSGTVRGRVRQDRILVATRASHRNSWLPVLTGHVRPTPTGCVVDGRIGVMRSVQAFCALWLGFALFFAVYALTRPGTGPFALLGVGMFVLGYGLAAAATHLDRGQTPVLIGWLHQTVADAPHHGSDPRVREPDMKE